MAGGITQYSEIKPVYLGKTGKPVVLVAPNPVKESLQVYAHSGRTEDNVQIMITNLNGQLLLQRRLNLVSGVNQILIHESGLWPAGDYIFLFKTGKEKITQKFTLIK
jgi:hypothetical protein